MMAIAPDCTYADDDTASRYVAGTLPATEAEAFEEHYFGCSRCWDEVRAGTAVRDALRKTPVLPRAATPMRWAGLAAAAVLIIIAATLIVPRLDRRDVDVERGAGREIVVAVKRAADELHASWPAVSNAARYEVLLQNIEGETLHRAIGTRPQITVKTPPGDVFLTVSAVDRDGEEIARSRPVRAPAP
jgi:putative zinc finger protein